MLCACYALRQYFHSTLWLGLSHDLLFWFSKYCMSHLTLSVVKVISPSTISLLSRAEIETICQYFPSLFDLLTTIIINFTPFQSDFFSFKIFSVKLLKSLTHYFLEYSKSVSLSLRQHFMSLTRVYFGSQLVPNPYGYPRAQPWLSFP